MSDRPLRILYVASCWPYGPDFGGRLRSRNIAVALQRIGSLSLALVGADEVDEAAKARTADDFEVAREIPLSTSPVRGLAGRARSLLDPDFTNIHGMSVAPEDEAWMLEAVKDYDLIWFSRLRTANMFRNAVWPRSVVDIDDLPSAMEQSFASSGANLVARLKASLRTWQLRLHERHLARRFSVMAVCSEADRKQVAGRGPVYVIPNGSSLPAKPAQPKPVTPPRIGFIGLFTYEPNHAGVQWFVDQVWPKIQAKVPGIRLRLVGAGTDGLLKPNDPAVDGLGFVDDPAGEIASWSLTIIPIRTGAGTRIKIPDAFSRKCPVVSTTLGAFGYEVENGRELLLADKPEEFATACVSLVKDREKAKEMALCAFEAFAEKWAWDAITPSVLAAAHDAINNG